MQAKDIAEANLIYKVRCGSHAYGTNLPTSDEDFAGIFIPPIEYYFGLRAFDLLSEQSEEDRSYYSLRKYATLAVANNPNVLELLFVDPSDVLLCLPEAKALREIRHRFLSQRAQKTFVGYAKAQLHRIRTHTKWLQQEMDDMAKLEPLVRAGNVSKEWVAWRFGENMLERVKDMWDNKSILYLKSETEVLEIFRTSNIICPERNDQKFFKLGQPRMFNGNIDQTWEFQKHIYDEAKKKRDQYVTWMAERNSDRHETEIRFGYDTKHAMHLVRLLRSGYEILTTGDLMVRRPDAQELLSIRAGKWSYDQVVSYADEMVAKIDSIPPEQFKVPATPDLETISKTIVDMTSEYLFFGDRR
jgi:hypothetical protein